MPRSSSSGWQLSAVGPRPQVAGAGRSGPSCAAGTPWQITDHWLGREYPGLESRALQDLHAGEGRGMNISSCHQTAVATHESTPKVAGRTKDGTYPPGDVGLLYPWKLRLPHLGVTPGLIGNIMLSSCSRSSHTKLLGIMWRALHGPKAVSCIAAHREEK